jgi:thiopurine S-methyltransferase
MDEKFWEQRWHAGQISFHEGRPNAFLVEHLARLGSHRRVLVPLCGKTEDLAYLAGAGHAVVGIELVADAAQAFFDEHPALRDGAVQILVGDFFAFTAADVGPCDAFYDRAAVIALPPSLRPRYVEHLRSLLPAGAPGLAITLEYDQTRTEGPPFAVLEPELRALWAGSQVDLIGERTATGGRLHAAGIATLERCYAITR